MLAFLRNATFICISRGKIGLRDLIALETSRAIFVHSVQESSHTNSWKKTLLSRCFLHSLGWTCSYTVCWSVDAACALIWHIILPPPHIKDIDWATRTRSDLKDPHVVSKPYLYLWEWCACLYLSIHVGTRAINTRPRVVYVLLTVRASNLFQRDLMNRTD